jgi:hypothetical protein
MEWSASALYDKARLYMSRAHEQPVDSQLFAFWASLSLELLCRAALAKVHPVLLADPREDGNLLYAFGVQPAKPPRSIVTKAIVIRCTALVDGFTEEMATHCALMADRRNAELHSGVVGFDAFDNAAWLPATYEVINVLLKHLGVSFVEFLGEEHAATAVEMLRDRRAAIKKEVLDRIQAAKAVYRELPTEERLRREARWSERREEVLKANSAHRETKCPACGSSAIMSGNRVSRGPVRIDESSNKIEREVRILPTTFRCPHCQLKLDGFQEMRQAGLGTVYTVIEEEDPVEFFGIDPSEYIDPDEFLREHYGPEYDNE